VLLSEVSYGSLLCYAPRGTDRAARDSQEFAHAIKYDQFIGEFRVIPLSIQRLREHLTPELDDLLPKGALLVPMPGSAPFRGKDYLWTPRRICEEMIEGGFGGSLAPLLTRRYVVTKSSQARPDERARPNVHYDSMETPKRLPFSGPDRIVVVDDVITMGATMLAGVSRIQEAFPGSDVRGFALVRSAFPEVFSTFINPFYGKVRMRQDGRARKEPS
jgi:hypothetical protein